ncbi:16S rRNA (cytidine(1402)-2'-O)-methyltransferase [Halocynthiibacter namhaensis]|uniref:16S rRNA (cytidine(1402)-2'-O)-methyltransferase n=1 Tax=Halocynthiibacter namhaensis TaxID=1290553 RepID=UPI000578E64F|nr:16S rRNA (cytidine(1402)-2'-O)-methyltransferase [Halocynthiibacter namhaensis]
MTDVVRTQISAEAGSIIFVATPIGTARDITLRALDILAHADVLVAEDTRTLRKLMDIHAIPLNGRPMIAYHDHNGSAVRPRLLGLLKEGKILAYASEAGTPLVADPGYGLAQDALDNGFVVTSAPGPSAVVTALTIAGLPTDRFFFAGFSPNTTAARKGFIEETREIPGTLVFYESPKRLAAFLSDAAEVLGDRKATVCRELTKKFEEARKGNLSELASHYQENKARGEVVVVIDRNRSDSVNAETLEDSLRQALTTMRVRDAADAVSAAHGVARRDVYQLAIAMNKEIRDGGDE